MGATHRSVTGLLTAIPIVPFNPRPLEWMIFAGLVALIVLIYVVRYLASNRKTHTYMHHTSEDPGGDAPGGTGASGPGSS